MTPMDPTAEVVVIGAGLSGLLAAGTLQAAGRRVVVLEKARGVGGRMATRRLDAHVADHGAQFFTAHQPRFRQLVDAWEQAGVARRWSTGFATPDGAFKDNGVPRYCGVPAMTAIAKHLARDLEVRLSARVLRVESREGGWTVTTEDGARHSSRALLLTAPVPQSLELLSAGQVALPEKVWDDLEPLDYAPCLTVIARLTGPSLIPEPGGLWMPGEPLLWLGDNQRKGVSTAPGAIVTLHAGQEFSRERWDTPESEVIAAIVAAAAPWLGSPVDHAQLHRWRYSVPLRVHPEPCLVATEPALIAFAGDAFGGPRVEAAALSGLAAGEALAARLG